MFNLLRKLFATNKTDSLSQSRTLVTGSKSAYIKIEQDHITTYPPYKEGFPVTDPDQLLRGLDPQMFTNLKQVLPFDDKDFDRLVYPLLENYASFVQLLPASQNHHHKAMGGLLHHGMDVAYKATQAARKVYFHEKDPQVRRENKPRWRLACFIAGLLHDIGKPYTDIHVHDESGKTTWDPEIESLYAWATRNNITKYFLDWRPGRHGQHLRYSAAGLERFLPEETRMYIRQFSPLVFEQLRVAVSEVSMDNNISRAVARADQESVRYDLERMGDDPAHYLTGIPIQRYAVSAIRRLLGSGKWTANQPGSKVFVLEDGVFVNWVAGFKDILELLESENVKGFPKDAFTIADKLVEARTAEPNFINSEIGEERDQDDPDADNASSDSYYVYWFIAVQFESEQVTSKKLDIKGTLKFKAGTIFPFEPPAPMVGNVVKKDKESDSEQNKTTDRDTTNTSAQKSGSASSSSSELNSQPSSTNNDSTEEDTNQAEGSDAMSALQTSIGNIEAELPLEAFGFDINEEAGRDAVTDNPRKDEKVTARKSQKQPEQKKANPDKQKNKSETHSSADKAQASAKTPSVPAVKKPAPVTVSTEKPEAGIQSTIASTLAGVCKKGEAYDLLHSMLEDVYVGKKAMGECLYQHGSKIALLYPDGAENYGKPSEVMKIFKNEGYIDHEPGMSMMFVRDISSYKALVFTNKIGNVIQKLIHSAEQELEPDSSSVSAEAAREEKEEVKAADAKSKEKQDSSEVKNASTGKKKKVNDKRQYEPEQQQEEPKKEVSDTEQEPAVTDRSEPEDIHEKDSMSLTQIFSRLQSMVIARKGKWIVSTVNEEDEGWLSIDAGCLKEIVKEHPEFTVKELRMEILRFKKTMKYKNRKVYVAQEAVTEADHQGA